MIKASSLGSRIYFDNDQISQKIKQDSILGQGIRQASENNKSQVIIKGKDNQIRTLDLDNVLALSKAAKQQLAEGGEILISLKLSDGRSLIIDGSKLERPYLKRALERAQADKGFSVQQAKALSASAQDILNTIRSPKSGVGKMQRLFSDKEIAQISTDILKGNTLSKASLSPKEQVDKFLKTYEDQKRQNQYQDALKTLNQAIQITPNNADLYLEKSRLLLQTVKSDADAALKALHKAKELKPHLDIQPQLSAVENERILKLVEKKDYGQALNRANLALADFPKDKEIYLELKKMISKSALKDANQQIENQPHSPAGYIQKTKALMDLGQNQEALKNAEQAVDLAPQDTSAQKMLQEVQARVKVDALMTPYLLKKQSGKNQEALNILNQALKLLPQDAELHLEKSKLLTEINPQESLKALQTAKEINPGLDTTLQLKAIEDAKIYNLIEKKDFSQALLLAMQAQKKFPKYYNEYSKLKTSIHKEALKDASLRLKASPDLPELHLQKAQALLGLAQKEEALKSAHKALDIAPRSPKAQDMLNQVQGELKGDELMKQYGEYRRIGQRDKALGVLNQALKLLPQDADLHVKKYELLLQQDPDQALKALQTAKKLNPSLDLKQSLASIEFEKIVQLMQTQKYDEALKRVEIALDKTQGDQGLLRLKGYIHLNAGQFQESAQAFTQAMTDIYGRLENISDSGRAKAYLALGQSQKALNDINALIKQAPKTELKLLKAQALLGLDKDKAAQELLQSIPQSDPKYKEAQDILNNPLFDFR